jgi:uncharacterized protein with FMN-binding domain
MMVKKLSGVLLIVSLVLGFLFMGCAMDDEEIPDPPKHAPYGDPPYTGEKTGTATGFHMEGFCKVVIALTLENGYITNVNFDGSEGNTASVGGRVLSSAGDKIIAKNSGEIDALSSATVTSGLVVEAGRKALAEIPGYDPD